MKYLAFFVDRNSDRLVWDCIVEVDQGEFAKARANDKAYEAFQMEKKYNPTLKKKLEGCGLIKIEIELL